MEVLAEGVETMAPQHALLSAAGCEYFQGYLYGRPMSLDAFEQRVADGKPQAVSTEHGQRAGVRPPRGPLT